ncbi:MAG TPA: hypothetical protein PK771_04640 [Spirochaetota bacterium]|nr:hypothetical protein [Spirochaetota bacterium]
MKKGIMLLVIAFMFTVGFSAFSQEYYVYDGDTFNVMLTSDKANTKIVKVQFSANNKWVDFKIIDFTDLEETGEGGFLYTVQDGKGVQFTVDYYRNDDYIIVTNVSTGTNWRLNRRP